MTRLAILGGEPTIRRPFDLRAKYFEEEYEGVRAVLDDRLISGFIANAGERFYGGPRVQALEEACRSYCGTSHAVALNSATSALHAALVAMGVGRGDEVVVPSVSMAATASAVLMAGGTPVFADIRPGTDPALGRRGYFNIDERLVAEAITDRTKVVVVVHLFGHAAHMAPILELAEAHGLLVLEDCAQAPGARNGGRVVGTFGDVGVFSFTQSKTVSAGEGGVAVTDDEVLALRMQLMRNHAEAMIEAFPAAEYPELLGYNYRMTELEAVVATAQFARLDEYNARRIELANALTGALAGTEGLALPDIAEGSENVFFLYPILYDAATLGISRESFVEAVRAEGVPMVAGYATPLPRLPLFAPYRHDGAAFGVASDLHDASLIVTKVCHHHDVTEEDMEQVAVAIHKVLANRETLADCNRNG